VLTELGSCSFWILFKTQEPGTSSEGKQALFFKKALEL